MKKSRFKQWSIQKQLSVIQIITLTLVFFFFSTILGFAYIKKQQSDWLETYDNITQILTYQLVAPLSFSDKQYASELLLPTLQLQKVKYLEVYDAQHQRFVSLSQKQPPENTDWFDSGNHFINNEVIVSRSIYDNNEYLGQLMISFDFNIFEATKYYLAAGLGFAFLALLLSLVISQRLFKRLTHPLILLANSFQNIRALIDNNSTLTTDYQGEIGLLYREFNMMLQMIKRGETELTRYNESLEQKIRERTHQLQLEKDRAENAANAKTRFLATMSHELRTPMNGVLATLDLFAKTPLNSEQQEYIRIIQNAGKGLLQVIDDILNFTAIESGKLVIHPTTTHLEQTCYEVMEMIHSQILADHKPIQLYLDYHHDAPVYFELDEQRLRQVLINLLGNAVKFTSEGHIKLKVWVDQKLNLQVEDSGIGFDKQQAERLFKAFSQLDSGLNRQFEGSGLGLAISKYLITAMSGTIHASGSRGRGAIFRIELPIVNPQPATPIKLSTPLVLNLNDDVLVNYLKSRLTTRFFTIHDSNIPKRSYWVSDKNDTPLKRYQPKKLIELNALPVYSGLSIIKQLEYQVAHIDSVQLPKFKGHVLVAEDNKVNQVIIKKQLEKLGLSCELAVNGFEAIAMFNQNQYDLVLMDCQMPGLDGFEATQSIRKVNQTCPILALTANTVEDIQEQCLACGMNLVLFKPINLEQLAAAFKDFLMEENF
jgi:signal transduction histidine kinase/CheY-like chemotaxis protein